MYPKVLRLERTETVAEKHILKFISDRGTTTVGYLINSGIISAQIGIDILANLFYKGNICFGNLENEPFGFVTEVHIDGK